MAEIWQFDLRHGNSPNPREGACLLDAVSWFEYGSLGDHPACVCPVIASFARIVNDMLPNDRRQELKPFILRLPGTVDPSAEQERAEFLIWQAIRIFAPSALEAAANVAVGNHATKLRLHAATLRCQTNQSAMDAMDAADAAANAASAADAADAADAAANAANAAYAAAFAADAANAASAADAAAYAAAYAAYAADAAAVSAEIYDLSIAALDGVLRIGKQADPIMPAVIEAANRSFVLARI